HVAAHEETLYRSNPGIEAVERHLQILRTDGTDDHVPLRAVSRMAGEGANQGSRGTKEASSRQRQMDFHGAVSGTVRCRKSPSRISTEPAYFKSPFSSMTRYLPGARLICDGVTPGQRFSSMVT